MAGKLDELPLPDALPLIPDGWRYESLADIVEERGLSYGIVQPGSETADGVPIVRVNNIRNGRIDTTDMLKVGADIEAKFRRSRLRGGEVLLTLVGTLGEVAIVPDSLRNWNVARAVGVIPVRKDPGSLWVSICLRSAFIQHCIRMWATTTVQATFNLRDLAKLPIPIPPTATREAIAGVIGVLDDKIELNRRMNATLESMARALFQSWFVDFDPVRAKLDGRPPTGMDKATADLFPDSFEESPVGHIPKGWNVLNLDATAHYLNGLALQKFPPGDGPTLPVIKIAQLRKGDSIGADQCNTNLPSAYIIKDGDVLFSWSGSLEVELWCGGSGALNQHLFKVTSPQFPKWFYYLWTHYHLDEFRLIAAGKATTMGHIQRSHLSDAKVLIPSRPLLDAMSKIMSPLIDQIIANRIQSRTLASVRDTLLPKLLSGELSVAEASRNADITG
jgi:type I restriction enzyme S subunit